MRVNVTVFTQLSRFEKLIAEQPSFHETLESGYRAVFSENPLADLQKSALVCSVAAAYQYFGFVVFGPLGRSLLARGISRTIGSPGKKTEEYIEAVTYSLLDDFNILQIVDGEPNWVEIDEAFALDFWKRLFASDSSEDEALGLNLLDPNFVRQMRSCAERSVESFLNSSDSLQLPAHLPADLDMFLSRAYQCCVGAVGADSMRLFFWRIETFSRLKETRQEFKFLLKDGSQISEVSLQKTAALLILLSDLSLANGSPFFPENPVSASCIAETLKANRAIDGSPLSLQLLQEWLSPQENEICNGLVLAVELGLVFKITPKANKSEFGLTTLGQTVLRPFRALLVEVLSGPEPWAAAPAQETAQPYLRSKKIGKIRLSKVKEKRQSSAVDQGHKITEGKNSESDAEGFLSAIQAQAQTFAKSRIKAAPEQAQQPQHAKRQERRVLRLSDTKRSSGNGDVR